MEKDKYVYGRGGKTEKKKEENIWGKAFVEGQYFCAEEKKGRE